MRPTGWATTSRMRLFVALVTLSIHSVASIRSLRIVSPLQALTIWDPEVKEEEPILTHRSRFLPRFRAGLEAEAKARRSIKAGRRDRLQAEATGSDWSGQAAAADRGRRDRDAKIIEAAYDQAVDAYDASQPTKTKAHNSNEYQFVGVINSAAAEKPISWYARKKPTNANWSLRLVHVNRDAIIKDLFGRGKVDIFAKYENTGIKDPETKQCLVNAKYNVRERSWKNLWNFSPKHFITDSSGMYWRERRLRPGLYTDGSSVYEASYRYRDGRNGMHKVSSFDKFLSSKAIDVSQKNKILKRLQEDVPDVVLEQ